MAKHDPGLYQLLIMAKRGSRCRPSPIASGPREGRALRQPSFSARQKEAYDAAVAHLSAGRLAEAEALCRDLMRSRPGNVEDLHLLGIIALRQGDATRAERLLREAVDSKPTDAAALSNLGHALMRLERFEEALGSFDRALVANPDLPILHNSRGIALSRLDRLDAALDAFGRALSLNADFPEALSNRGNVLKAQRRYGEALKDLDRSLALKPDLAEALNNRATVLIELQRFDEALASAERALILQPGNAQALNNRGLALLHLKRFQEALGDLNEALRVNPRLPQAFNNRALALCQIARYEEALKSSARAVAIDPGLAEAHWAEGMTRLLIGDFERGWAKYEWRWKCAGLGSRPRDFAQPLWRGEQDPAARTILLHAEQGLGDTLQFCRYASLVAQRGARVVLEVQPALKTLLGSLHGPLQLLARGEPLPAFDLHCPLMSLPLALHTTLQTIPAAVPYLQAPAERLHLWQERLGVKRAVRVGLVWAGNPDHKNDRNRSLPLARLQPLDALGLELYSLQQEVRRSDQPALAAFRSLRHFGAELRDFADTAALASLMDVVIAVDTAVAHLAGALGLRVWILQPHAPEWRWLVDREDSPWYPTARLFRQPAFDDWDSVVARLVDELQRLDPHVSAQPPPVDEAPSDAPHAESASAAIPTPIDADALTARIKQGVAHFQSGRLTEAEQICAQVLRRWPDNCDALHLLGVLRLQQGKTDSATALITRVLRIDASLWYAHNTLGSILLEMREYVGALASFDRALALNPDNPGVHNNRAVALIRLGRATEAVASADRALRARPHFPEAANTRESALRTLDRLERA